MGYIACQYCKSERPIWAADNPTNPSDIGNYQNAHIRSGTNIFVDTAGRTMNFRFCPMCGCDLLEHRPVANLFAFLPKHNRPAIA